VNPHEDLKRILDGEDFRIERDDAFILDGTTGSSRSIPGVRLFFRQPSGRWKKSMWLVANKENGPETIQSAVMSLARALTAEITTVGDEGE
jgi:hypothetical protein